MTQKTIAIIEARFYQQVIDDLVKGAMPVLEKAGFAVERFEVPGAYEVPAALNMIIKHSQFEGAVALGCVVRGKTSHYDHICNSVFEAVQDKVTEHQFPFGMGILTCEDQQQALYRADPAGPKNVGGYAARAMVTMYKIKQYLNKPNW